MKHLSKDRSMQGMNELIDRCVNRHIARLLSELEEANCPAIYRDAVKGKLGWLRSDLHELITKEPERTNDRQTNKPIQA